MTFDPTISPRAEALVNDAMYRYLESGSDPDDVTWRSPSMLAKAHAARLAAVEKQRTRWRRASQARRDRKRGAE